MSTKREHLSVEEILNSPEFRSFHQAAVAYCTFMEDGPPCEGVDLLKQLRLHLTSLYASAIRLPWVDLQSNVDHDIRIDDKVFKEFIERLSARLNGTRFYWHVFDPTNERDTEAVCGDLVDDLADIYKDLKHALLIFDSDLPDSRENALWDFRFDFETHWDDHCINALSAVHFYLSDEW